MSIEETARKYATNLEKYLLFKSPQLSNEISDLISTLKNTRWIDMYSKIMIYRLLSDDEKLSTVREKLPFLTESECLLVKRQIDYIVDLAAL